MAKQKPNIQARVLNDKAVRITFNKLQDECGCPQEVSLYIEELEDEDGCFTIEVSPAADSIIRTVHDSGGNLFIEFTDILNRKPEDIDYLTDAQTEDGLGRRWLVTCCNTVIQSQHQHDFVQCKCGKNAVDGGNAYTRMVGDPSNFHAQCSLCGKYGPHSCNPAAARKDSVA